jgi:hypothetical protein
MQYMDAQRQAEVSHIVDKICNGDFDQGDIEILLFKIREEEGLSQTLRELGDFIAHRKKDREQGRVTKGVFKFAFFMLHFIEYSRGRKVDYVNEKFPEYFKKLLLLTINDFTNDEIKKGCNLSKEKLKDEIKRRFKFTNSDKTEVKLDISDLLQNNYDKTKFINSLIAGIALLSSKLQLEAFHQNEVINELTNFLDNLLSNFNKVKFLKQESLIILCKYRDKNRLNYNLKSEKLINSVLPTAAKAK